MQTVGALSSLPVVRDFRLSGPVAASASPTLPQDEVKLGGGETRIEPTALPLARATPQTTAPLNVAQEPPPQLLVDLDGQLGLPTPTLSGETPTVTPAGSNPALLTQFDSQSGNQVRIDQQAFQDTLTLDLGGPASVTLQHVDDLSELNGRLPSPAELSKLTAAFYDSSRIPFEYINDGCYARAHLMCESLRQKGINHSKVFVFGSLGAKNDVQQAKWWYHVAPLVFVQDPESGAVDARVLDPAVSREPMTVADWVQSVNRGGPVRLDLTQALQYTPRERSGVPLSFEQNLGPAQNTLKSYANALTLLAPERPGPVRGGDLAEGQSDLFPQGLPEPPPDIMAELNRLIMAGGPGPPPMMPMPSLGLGFGGMLGGMMGFGPGNPALSALMPPGFGSMPFRPYGELSPTLPPWMTPPKAGGDQTPVKAEHAWPPSPSPERDSFGSVSPDERVWLGTPVPPAKAWPAPPGTGMASLFERKAGEEPDSPQTPTPSSFPDWMVPPESSLQPVRPAPPDPGKP